MSDADTARRAVHDALREYLEEGELAISWVVTIDVVGVDGGRYLLHRAGGGHDGTDGPMSWTALGMLRASARLAEDQVAEQSPELGDEDEPGGSE